MTEKEWEFGLPSGNRISEKTIRATAKRIQVYGFMEKEGVWERIKAVFRPKTREFGFTLLVPIQKNLELVLVENLNGAAFLATQKEPTPPHSFC